MNKDSLREYIFAAQRGDRQALVELLTYSWGIVHYQCGKLLPSRQSAEKMTTVVLKTVAEKLDSLQEPERFYNWMGHLTAMRCMRVRATLLENGQTGESTERVSFSFPSMELNKAETAKVAEMLTDMLDTDQKLSLYLFSLGTLTPKAIGQLTGVPEETVQAQIQSAQQAVLGQMKRYAQQGVTFTQANSLPALLRTRMLLNPAPEKAQLVVYSILPQQTRRPAPEAPRNGGARPRNPQPQEVPKPKSEKGLIRTLAIIAGILAVVLVISLTVLFTKLKKAQPAAWAPLPGQVQLLLPEAPQGYIL